MIKVKFLLHIFINLLIFQNSKAVRSFDIRWTRTNCSILDESYVNLFDCTLKEIPRSRGNVLTAHVKFNANINNSLVDFRVSVPPSGGKTKEIEILKFRIDGCKMANYQTGNPVVNAMIKKMIKIGNFPKGCPLKKNLSYKLQNFALNPNLFPDYTPEINFFTRISMLAGKTHILYASIEASIVKKTNVKN